jgi:hypothetical protein
MKGEGTGLSIFGRYSGKSPFFPVFLPVISVCFPLEKMALFMLK